MGWPMAANLKRAGLLNSVWNRTTENAVAFGQQHDAQYVASPEELAQDSEAIVLCVSRDEDVLDLARRLGGALKTGTLIIDCSTVSAETAREAAAIVAVAGGSFLDCPVSGGTEGARDAALAIMCGGDEPSFERARPVLEAMGRNIRFMGPSGSGQATKAVNQIAVAGINQAVTEALAFAMAEGLPIDDVIDVLSKGAAGNWFLTHRGPTMVRGQYPLGFKVELHRKDLEICKSMAAGHGAQLPIVEMTLVHYGRLIDDHAGDDISSLFELKKGLFDRSK